MSVLDPDRDADATPVETRLTDEEIAAIRETIAETRKLSFFGTPYVLEIDCRILERMLHEIAEGRKPLGQILAEELSKPRGEEIMHTAPNGTVWRISRALLGWIAERVVDGVAHARHGIKLGMSSGQLITRIDFEHRKRE